MKVRHVPLGLLLATLIACGQADKERTAEDDGAVPAGAIPAAADARPGEAAAEQGAAMDVDTAAQVGPATASDTAADLDAEARIPPR